MVTSPASHSAALGIAGIFLVTPVWLAGSHRYGLLAGIWQYVNLDIVLLLAVLTLILGTGILQQGISSGQSRAHFIIPVFVLAFAWVQLLLIAGLYTVKVVLHID